MSDSKKELYQAKREELKALSKTVKPLVDEGIFESVNAAIVAHYKSETGAEEFNTFGQWRKADKSVQKGQKAVLVWGKPRQTEQDSEEDNYKFWPVCYLFSNLQVA